jgi:hypothetical protein
VTVDSCCCPMPLTPIRQKRLVGGHFWAGRSGGRRRSAGRPENLCRCADSPASAPHPSRAWSARARAVRGARRCWWLLLTTLRTVWLRHHHPFAGSPAPAEGGVRGRGRDIRGRACAGCAGNPEQSGLVVDDERRRCAWRQGQTCTVQRAPFQQWSQRQACSLSLSGSATSARRRRLSAFSRWECVGKSVARAPV